MLTDPAVLNDFADLNATAQLDRGLAVVGVKFGRRQMPGSGRYRPMLSVVGLRSKAASLPDSEMPVSEGIVLWGCEARK